MSSTLEVFEIDLRKLLCSVCDEPFTIDEVIVFAVNTSTETKEVILRDLVGIKRKEVKPNHSIRLMHGSRECYQRNKMRAMHGFMSVLLQPARDKQRRGRDVMDVHMPLFKMFQRYEAAEVKLDMLPTLQITHATNPSLILKAAVKRETALAIADRKEWTMQRLSHFVQRFVEVRITLRIGINSDKSTLLALQADLMDPHPSLTSLWPEQSYHVWLELEPDRSTDRSITMRLLVWQGLQDTHLKAFYHHFMSEQTVVWSDLVAGTTPTESCSELNKAFIGLHDQLDGDLAKLIGKGFIGRKWKESLALHNPEVTQSSAADVTLFSRVQVENTLVDDVYTVQLNTQSMPRLTDYFMLQWKEIPQPASSSSSTEPVRMPCLIQIRGHAMDPGIPVEVEDKEAVLLDLTEDVNLKAVATADSRVFRVL
jgi:hypothetical protein